MKTIHYYSDEAAQKGWGIRRIYFYLGQVLIYLGLVLVALAIIWLGLRAVAAYKLYQAVRSRPLPELAASLSGARDGLAPTEMRLRQYQAALKRLGLQHLSPVAWLDQSLSRGISGVRLAQILPTLLGQESPQTYLILVQNSDELRPSGGYITAAGHITVDRGEIVEFLMQDSYAVDRLSDVYPYPPEPLYKYMAADYWLLRDASWSPDFPTTARTAIELYELGQGISAQGVIALDQQALPYILRAFGRLEVEGEQVTSDNVIALMRRHWAPAEGHELNREWWAQRKSFMLSLAERLRQKLQADAASVDLSLLVGLLKQALAEKHVLVYLSDPAAAELLAWQNWDGALLSRQGDYLMVVDANIGFNKASALVERQLTYQVVLTGDGSALAHLSLLYRHQGQRRPDSCSAQLWYDPVYEQNMVRCYWNYLRVITPAQARLLNGPANVVAGQSLLRGQATTGQIDLAVVGPDKVSWGQLFLLAPQESLSLDYDYILPANTAWPEDDHWRYRLSLQKQPGTLRPPAEIIVVLPQGAQLYHSRPQPFARQEEKVTYRFDQRTDLEIDLSYSLP